MEKDNNGWTKISDLLPPDDNEKYYVCLDGMPHDYAMSGSLIKMNRNLVEFQKSHVVTGGRYLAVRAVTHWMPAVKLKAPLY